MSTPTKSQLWRELQDAGVVPDRHYRNYTVAELTNALAALRGEPIPEPEPEKPVHAGRAAAEAALAYSANTRIDSRPAQLDTIAGAQPVSRSLDEPLRIDPETGFEWFQEEVRKPVQATPRARRVVRYNEAAVAQQTFALGERGDTESFEVPQPGGNKTGEARITMPSYQVGIYRDPRLPFKIHIYNDDRAFDLFEVQEYYGGADMVPSRIKVKYVSSTMGYDISTVIREIRDEARRQNLHI